MKQYKIHYEVDTGCDHIGDIAIIRAENESEAIQKLKSYIWDTGYEHMVSQVFYVKEFTEDVYCFRFVTQKRR